jgi:hypothetical protein
MLHGLVIQHLPVLVNASLFVISFNSFLGIYIINKNYATSFISHYQFVLHDKNTKKLGGTGLCILHNLIFGNNIFFFLPLRTMSYAK